MGGWGESGLSAVILCKCSFNQCQLLSAKEVTDSALWETLLSSASWFGTERLSTAQPGGKSHLQVKPPGLITETNHEENLTVAWRRVFFSRSFGPGVNDWLWTRSKLSSSWLSSGGGKRGEREQNDAPLETIKMWEDLMLSVFINFNNMTKNT